MVRWILRVALFGLICLGVLIGLIYPWAAVNQTGRDIGTWRVYGADNGFAEIETILPPGEELVVARVEIALVKPLQSGGGTMLVMTVATGDRTISTQSFDLESAERRDASDVYTVASDPVHVIGDRPYSFAFEHGSAGFELVSADLTLVGGIYEFDESVPPIGWGFMAAGLVGFALTLRKRGSKAAPPPRWGRG